MASRGDATHLRNGEPDRQILAARPISVTTTAGLAKAPWSVFKIAELLD